MPTPYAAVPFEKQSDPETSRSCGAACLSMVYHVLGKPVEQASIWPAIAKVNQSGSVASTTHLMVADAIGKGFSAVAIQARHPLQVLRRCIDGGVRVILNHRLKRDSPVGHYSVLVDMDDKSITLHDPLFGPSQRLTAAELIELWRPGYPNSEIAGNILIGIAAEPQPPLSCEFCHTPIPPKIVCPRCKKPMSLQPSAALGCARDGCIARMWNYVACPSCDFLWSFNQSAQTPNPAAVPRPLPMRPDVKAPLEEVDFEKVFAAVDKFCDHILTIPTAAARADLRAQIDFIRGMKDKLKLAEVEQRSHVQGHAAALTAIALAGKEKHEAHQKRVEELNQPAPPLDGDALGHALLKRLGLG